MLPDPERITHHALHSACQNAFPGTEFKSMESAGRYKLVFWVWNFKVTFVLVMIPMDLKEKEGVARYEVRFRWDGQQGYHLIGSRTEMDEMAHIHECLKELKQFVNGCAAAITMAQVDLGEQPVDILGMNAKKDRP